MATETNNLDENQINAKDSSQEKLVTTFKQKTPIPIRILEEEVWLSGSELKTDNSSSDEDHLVQSIKKQAEDRVKKGARKKIRYLSSQCSTTEMITNKKQQHEKFTTRSKLEKITTKTTKLSSSSSSSLSSTTATSMATNSSGNYDMVLISQSTDDVQWRPKRGSVSLPAGLSSELERIQI